MPANVYMSLYGSDSNDGLTPSTPKRSFSAAVGLLANKPGTEQTVWIRGGPSRATAYEYGTLSGSPERWMNTTKSGTANGWIVFRNYPGEFVTLKPLDDGSDTAYQYAVSTSTVEYNAFIWDCDEADLRNPSKHHFELDGGCTGLLSNGVTYDGTNYTPTPGVYMRGISGFNMVWTGLVLDGNGDQTNPKYGAYWSGGYIHHVKKAFGVISNLNGPTVIRAAYCSYGAMENVHIWAGDYGAGGTASGVWPHTLMINSTNYFASLDDKSLDGPAVIEDCVLEHTWGETIGPYSVNSSVVRRNKVLNACLGYLYNDIGTGIVIEHNILVDPSDRVYSRVGWGLNVSSEKPPKWVKDAVINSNVMLGPGIVLGWVKGGENTLVRDILCVNNTVLDTVADQSSLDSWLDLVDPSVKIYNNVFVKDTAGDIESYGNSTNFGTHAGNRWSKSPATTAMLSGTNNAVLATSAMKISRSTPTTMAGVTHEYFRPESDSPLLGDGTAWPTPTVYLDESTSLFGKPLPVVVIGTPPIGYVWRDIDGQPINTAAPSIGAFQSSLTTSGWSQKIRLADRPSFLPPRYGRRRDPDVLRYVDQVAAVGGSVSQDVASALSNLFAAIKRCGVWQSIDVLQLLCTDTVTGITIPQIGSLACTLTGLTNSEYNLRTGFTKTAAANQRVETGITLSGTPASSGFGALVKLPAVLPASTAHMWGGCDQSVAPLYRFEFQYDGAVPRRYFSLYYSTNITSVDNPHYSDDVIYGALRTASSRLSGIVNGRVFGVKTTAAATTAAAYPVWVGCTNKGSEQSPTPAGTQIFGYYSQNVAGVDQTQILHDALAGFLRSIGRVV